MPIVSNNLVDFVQGMTILGGFNSISLENRGTALTGGGIPAALPGAGGQTTSAVIKLINRQSDLAEVLSLDIKASLRYALFGGGNVKFNFYNSTNISSYTVDLVIYIKVSNAQKTVNLNEVSLTNQSQAVYEQNMALFNDTYGTSFVYGLITGGECFIRLSLQSEDSQTLRSFSGAIRTSGSIGAWSGSASVEALKQIQETTKAFQMSCHIERSGPNDALPDINDQKAILDYALNFPAKISDNNAVVYQALVMPYEHQFIPKIGLIDRQNQIESLESLGKIRNDLISNLNDHFFALGHPDDFSGIPKEDIERNYNDISLAKTEVEALARRCFNNAINCQPPSAQIIELTKKLLPEQKQENNMNIFPIGAIIKSELDYATFCKMNGWKPEFDVRNHWAPCDGRNVVGSKYQRDGGKNNVPDLRGLFVRGVNDMGVAGVNMVENEWKNEVDKKAGEKQQYALRKHTHNYEQPNSYDKDNVYSQYIINPGAGYGKRYHNSTNHVGHLDSGEEWSSTEVRPKNMSLYYFIRIN